MVQALSDPEVCLALRHMLPLYECVRDFACNLMNVYQGRHQHDLPAQKPWIVVLGDDHICGAFGPDAFHGPSLDVLITAASYVVLIDSGPEPFAYNTAATVAARHRRNVILIETAPEVAEDWHNRIRALAPDMGMLWSKAMGPA